MKINALRVTCKCGHVFDAEVVVNAPIAVVAASIKTAPKLYEEMQIARKEAERLRQ
jgi:hypothetical protein